MEIESILKVHFTRDLVFVLLERFTEYSIKCNASVTIVFHMLIKLTEYKLSQLFFYR